MSSAFDIKLIPIYLGDPAGDNKQIFAVKAPSDSQGGGITVLGAYAVNGATTSGGTTFSVQLLKYSAAGTPALNGTITAVLGGTTDYWAAGVQKSFVLGADTFVDANEWIVVDYQEDSDGNPTNMHIALQAIQGQV